MSVIIGNPFLADADLCSSGSIPSGYAAGCEAALRLKPFSGYAAGCEAALRLKLFSGYAAGCEAALRLKPFSGYAAGCEAGLRPAVHLRFENWAAPLVGALPLT